MIVILKTINLFLVIQISAGKLPESVRFSDTWCESRRLKCVIFSKNRYVLMHNKQKSVSR
jgi:hypothetical protein